MKLGVEGRVHKFSKLIGALACSALGWAATLMHFEAGAAAAAQPPVRTCVISNFVIGGNQSDGGAGSYDTFVYLTNSGPTCRLVPMGARAFNATTRTFVGTAASISKPDVATGQLFPYATKHLLGSVAYGQSVSLDMRYADVGSGMVRDCGRIIQATSMAFWMQGQPRAIKVAHLVYGLRGALTSLQTCSKATYLWVFWPSTGPFWFAN
jgi:hypothetical protein